MTRNEQSDIASQARVYLESLHAAGISHLPARSGLAEVAPTSAVSGAGPSELEYVHARTGLFDQPQQARPAAVLTAEQKRAALAKLCQEVACCQRCPELVHNRTQTVFGVGDPGAELVFVGEAPGAEEDAQGEPFVGAAGQLLTRIIEACGLRRGQVYICNVLKCRPPGNRTPLPHEIANCFPYLEQQLALIRPRAICALGAVAAQTLLQTRAGISKLRGQFHDYRGIPVLCTYHPAYLLRNPSAKREVWEDMKKLMMRLGRPIPRK
ncbi:MAG: uracil-DNA glycosylase [Gemmataceae bacterium]